MKVELDIQNASTEKPVPDREQFRLWVECALQGRPDCELTLRLVDKAESRQLNSRYRGKDKPTNVLSFPAELPPGIDIPLLGDIVLCAPVVAEEAAVQDKPVAAHWAHLVIHGVLHLLGHEHQHERDAAEMESIEIEMLSSLGIANPYG
ncbi:MAG: rRNA maturation RNase YbeY [Xanthomonadales bacterium]|nr:rRNA maturation RNase YbeY [Gammaproteobacteria bacterium]MBT8053342.1 rRNA maturation RNase YbeY [Gammaproteobacteria bacterium]NND58054.1 rRNA maturation RNase YbeY [Xanthomonadales bacterium]NNK52151.1 rRNA maturation RNase YbeY [Xanthomonadales bacterium]